MSKEEDVTTQEDEVVVGDEDEEKEETASEEEQSTTVCETCDQTIADAELADHVRSHQKNGKPKSTSAVKATVDPARPNRVVLDRWPTEEEKKAARGE